MWNYRLIQLNDCLGICEVYYNDDGKIVARTEPLLVIDEVDDMPKLLAQIAEAAKKDIIHE
jgi:hypothetical protein